MLDKYHATHYFMIRIGLLERLFGHPYWSYTVLASFVTSRVSVAYRGTVVTRRICAGEFIAPCRRFFIERATF